MDCHYAKQAEDAHYPTCQLYMGVNDGKWLMTICVRAHKSDRASSRSIFPYMCPASHTYKHEIEAHCDSYLITVLTQMVLPQGCASLCLHSAH